MSRSARFEEIEDDGSISHPAASSRITEVAEDAFDDDFDMPLPELPDDAPIPAVPRAGQSTGGNIGAGGHIGGASSGDRVNPQGIRYVEDDKLFKSWLVLYPIYFDATRTAAHGRRVSRRLAVRSPLAKTLADACKEAGFNVVFEPQKTHPADWSNPGRVRIQWREDAAPSSSGVPARDAFGRLVEKTRPGHPVLKSRKMLYGAISEYLHAHPTTQADPFKVPVPGFPTKPYTAEQVAKGEDKMGKIYRSARRADAGADAAGAIEGGAGKKEVAKGRRRKSKADKATSTAVSSGASGSTTSAAAAAKGKQTAKGDDLRAQKTVRHGNKVNEHVPLHSPARSGGGINNDMFKGMMPGLDSLMGGAGPGGAASGSGSGHGAGGTDGGGAAIEEKKTPSKKDLKKPKMKRQFIRG